MLMGQANKTKLDYNGDGASCLHHFSKHLEFHPLFYVFARFLQVGTAAFGMLWHLSSSTQSYGILITSLDTDCPSTGWPVGERKFSRKICWSKESGTAMEWLGYEHQTQNYDSISFNIGLYGCTSSACHVLFASYVGMAHHDSKLRAAGCREHLGKFCLHPVCISSCKYSWNTRETWNVLEALNDVKWEKKSSIF